jgi:hypothetical protein
VSGRPPDGGAHAPSGAGPPAWSAYPSPRHVIMRSRNNERPRRGAQRGAPAHTRAQKMPCQILLGAKTPVLLTIARPGSTMKPRRCPRQDLPVWKAPCVPVLRTTPRDRTPLPPGRSDRAGATAVNPTSKSRTRRPQLMKRPAGEALISDRAAESVRREKPCLAATAAVEPLARCIRSGTARPRPSHQPGKTRPAPPRRAFVHQPAGWCRHRRQSATVARHARTVRPPAREQR